MFSVVTEVVFMLGWPKGSPQKGPVPLSLAIFHIWPWPKRYVLQGTLQETYDNDKMVDLLQGYHIWI